jgi:lycopene beta-cyclase
MHYDYIIIGMGGAGGHLINAFLSSNDLSEKRILVLDKNDKNKNDRTWCFWEKGKGQFDHLLEKKWSAGSFKYNNKTTALSMEDYQYKMIPSDRFYDHVKQLIENNSNIESRREAVINLTFENKVSVHTSNQVYTCDHVFDSRIDPKFKQENDSSIRILQHFKGWTIETERPVFDADKFVMMDFSFPWKSQTSFFYILPISQTKALIEFTLFDTTLLKEEEYQIHLKQYVEKHLGIDQYEILEEEAGIIPMSTYPFHKANNVSVTKIGTAGSWVRPSSGYMFKNAERYSQKIVENILNNKIPSTNLFRKQDLFYDRIFLDVLKNQNHLGPEIFAKMYAKNSTAKIFEFLDGKTNLFEELQIISRFKSWPFLKGLFRQYILRR